MIVLPDREIVVTEDENICSNRKYYRARFKSPKGYSKFFEVMEPIPAEFTTVSACSYTSPIPPGIEEIALGSYIRRKTIELKQMCAPTEKEAVKALLDDYVEQYYHVDVAQEARHIFATQIHETIRNIMLVGLSSHDFDAVLVSEARLKFMQLNVGDIWMGFKLCSRKCESDLMKIEFIKTKGKK